MSGLQVALALPVLTRALGRALRRRWRGLALLLLAATTALALWGWRAERQARQVAELGLTAQRQLNDSTAVRLAAARGRIDGLERAARALGGRAVAGVTIRVPARDTVLVHDTLPTTLAADSTRTATFRDSTFAGVVTGTVTAPPCCAPLGVTVQLRRPAFAPTVGFVQTRAGVVATVVWAGERVTLDTPFAAWPRPRKRVVPFVELLRDPEAWTARVGVGVRGPWGLSAVAAVDQRVTPTDRTRLQAGLRAEF